jgi:hypothetical protein
MADPYSLASVEEVQARLDWTLDDGERQVADGAITDLSDDARFYGSNSWTEANCPRQVKNLVVRAAARFMRNPDGYVTSRAGDETVAWTDRKEDAGVATFTRQEQDQLAELAGNTRTGLTSVPMAAFGPTRKHTPRYVFPSRRDIHSPYESEVTYSDATGRPIPYPAED